MTACVHFFAASSWICVLYYVIQDIQDRTGSWRWACALCTRCVCPCLRTLNVRTPVVACSAVERSLFVMLALFTPCCCFVFWKPIWYGPHTHTHTHAHTHIRIYSTVHTLTHSNTHLHALEADLIRLLIGVPKRICLPVYTLCRRNGSLSHTDTHIKIICFIFVSPRSSSSFQ